MFDLFQFCKGFPSVFEHIAFLYPWEITSQLSNILPQLILKLDDSYVVENQVAIHKTALLEKGVIIKPPAIISENTFIGAHAYLRGGVYLGSFCSIGPSCEIKSSILLDHTAVAHFNFIGDSIIGSFVNFEAGSVVANHFNERTHKRIYVYYHSQQTDTHCEKFGALVGDSCKIGANAVLSPGTILEPGTIVSRLELVDQSKKKA